MDKPCCHVPMLFSSMGCLFMQVLLTNSLDMESIIGLVNRISPHFHGRCVTNVGLNQGYLVKPMAAYR